MQVSFIKYNAIVKGLKMMHSFPRMFYQTIHVIDITGQMTAKEGGV